MTKVTLYKIHSGFANVPDRYEIESHLADEFNGDFAADFVLPDGYSIDENRLGFPMIFDPSGRGCEILNHTSGRPQLFSGFGASPVLERAE